MAGAFLFLREPNCHRRESVLGVGELQAHSYFLKIGPPSDPKSLKNKEIFAVGLIRSFLNYLSHKIEFNLVGFDRISAAPGS